MSDNRSHQSDQLGPALEVYLLGTVDYDSALALQHRLVYEAGGRADGQMSVLMCEHPNTLSVGRAGSRGHWDFSSRELASRRMAVHWVNRGGGCVVHMPGQLAVYPIVPLAANNLSVGDYLRRLQCGLTAALADLGIQGQARPHRFGIWGRTGQLVSIAASVKNWVTYHGAFLSVAAPPNWVRRVVIDPFERSPLSSLSAERQRPVQMTSVRSAVIAALADALGCQRYHLYSGHPLFSWPPRTRREHAARAS